MDRNESDSDYSRSRYRNWCWTLNNPTVREYHFWQDIRLHGHERIMFVSWQEEWPIGGTLHYQGYMELKKPMRRSTMKNVFGRRIHWERRFGTQLQAYKYTKKADEYNDRDDARFKQTFEHGVLKRGGSDRIELAVAAIDDGMCFSDLIDNYPVVTTMHKEKMMDRVMTRKPSRNWAMEIIILIGATGTGKTTFAYEEYPDLWPMPMSNKWMTGYMAQDTVLMDDFGGQFTLMQMMQFFDRHKLPGMEAKYRSFEFKSHRIVITTNVDPRDWFKEAFAKDDTHKEAMRRRIREFAKIYDCTGVYPLFERKLRTAMFYWRGEIPAGGVSPPEGTDSDSDDLADVFADLTKDSDDLPDGQGHNYDSYGEDYY